MELEVPKEFHEYLGKSSNGLVFEKGDRDTQYAQIFLIIVYTEIQK